MALDPRQPWNTSGVPQGKQESPTDCRGSPTSSERKTQHKTGIPIAALDISPGRTHAVLAGRDILKTIQVEDFTCAEDFNLRTNIIAYAATHETSAGAISARHRDQLAAQDVKWSHGNFGTTIATAAANGNIVVYDINRPGVEIARLHEHSRQVHRLGFNPHAPHLMLSGSQDSTVRLWDLRQLAGERSVMTCQSLSKFSGNSDGIRDLRWSPTNGVEFAIGTDNGTIQRWDIRRDSAPLLKINAHEKTCNVIDWHPDGKHIASGGADKNVKVWDFSSSDRRMKHLWQIRAPQAVVSARWRPACWSLDKEGSPHWQGTQIATSYDQQETKIHVWDFRRPYVPFREVNRYDTPATGLLWKSESLLWSVGSAGMFTQTDIHFATRTSDRRSSNTVEIAPDGRVLFFLQKRERRRTSIKDMLDDFDPENPRRNSTSEKVSSNHGTTQGSSEEPSLLSSSFKNRQRKHPASLRSMKSLADTPTSAGSTGPVQRLDISLHEREMFHSAQAAGIGRIGGLSIYNTFKIYAREYHIPPPEPPNDDSECNRHHEVANALRSNGEIAAQAGEYQLAGTWKVMAKAMEIELGERAKENRQKRLKAASFSNSMKRASFESTSNNDGHTNEDHESQMLMSTGGKLRPRNKASSALDDASNMTTPLARPQSDTLTGSNVIANIESLQLSDAVWSKQPLKPVTGVSQLAKMTSPKSHTAKTNTGREGSERATALYECENERPPNTNQTPPRADFGEIDRQMIERRAAMENYRAIPRPLLRLDDPFQLNGPSSGVASIDRHDSNESFQLFSASTDSSNRAQSVLGSFESNTGSEKTSSSPERLNALNNREGQISTSHEQSALVFEDEASLRSQASSLASPNTISHHQPTKPPEQHFPPATLLPSYRPSNTAAMVHHEDMETNGLGPWVPDPPTTRAWPRESDYYILSDFDRPKQRSPSLHPWTATAIFEEVISYYTLKLHDAQFPAYLVLHLAPYLDHAIPFERCNLILLQYHEQLITNQLFVEANKLLNYCDPAYPDVVDQGLHHIASGGPWCTVCQKPNKGQTTNFCERCQQLWAECPICYGAGLGSPMRHTQEPVDWQNIPSSGILGKSQQKNDLWGWCQECGHGGHTDCLRIWWSDLASGGACPTIGCMCDCVPGTRRDAIVERKEQGRRAESVSKDERYAAESGAVRGARVMVGGSSRGPGPGTLGLGATGRSMSGGKKVRIVIPEEQGKVAPGSPGLTGKTSASVP
ncbi:SEA (Seh1-associated) complex subunit [Imshaugia aleurites]|uniref:SEA (Seh1-associated) complex subunit n=1 Tax=Imshaugia aleurites TaxID=172621 RepID=A0A8H3FSM1_9LECA|nr:SEA (Seh1-associated) complex subunit [Imshaugia aleurites]